MVRLALIEDNNDYRTTLSRILQRNKEIVILHELNDCEKMIPLFEVDLPELVIMDIDLPGISGIEGVWQLRQHWPEMKVLMLTVFEDAEKIFGAIKAGANGYLLKNMERSELIDAIDTVLSGKVFLSKAANQKVLEQFSSVSSALNSLPALTRREKEILQWLNEGLTGPQIAEKLFLSHFTIETHRKNLMQKLNVNSLPQLLKVAREKKLI